MKSQQLYSKINEDFKSIYEIKPTDVWYPDFSRKDITDMREMFRGSDLTNLDLSN